MEEKSSERALFLTERDGEKQLFLCRAKRYLWADHVEGPKHQDFDLARDFVTQSFPIAEHHAAALTSALQASLRAEPRAPVQDAAAYEFGVLFPSGRGDLASRSGEA